MKLLKTSLVLSVFFSMLFSCSNNSVVNTNPYIPDYNVTVDINMNLPLYSKLLYPNNAIYYAGKGAKGLIIFNTGSGYTVFDAACPNQSLSSCSTLTINGIEAVCPCDDKTYSLFTGQGSLQYPMKQYRVEVSGNVLRIYN
jgi:nitrite reductase/ring-hydroxylating ferredoxin subunit